MRQKGNVKEFTCWGSANKRARRHRTKFNRHSDLAPCTSAHPRTPFLCLGWRMAGERKRWKGECFPLPRHEDICGVGA